jgi:hypothetical protein
VRAILILIVTRPADAGAILYSQLLETALTTASFDYFRRMNFSLIFSI